MSRGWGVRVRTLLDDRFVVAVLVAVVLLAAGGYATYTAYASPGTTTEQRQVSSWEGNGTYALNATVTEPNPLYPVGTELADRPAYFLSVSPIAEGTFRFDYAASDGGTATVTVRQTLVIRATEPRSSGEEVVEYWRVTEPLGSDRATDVAPGESVELSFERDVNRTYARMANVSERLGGTPGTPQLLVVSAVEFEGSVNGDDVARTARYRLPIHVDGTTYRAGEQGGEAVSGSTTETITRERTHGPLYRIGGPVASLAGLAGLAGLVYGRRDGRFAVAETERAALDFRSTREEFDDWITTARLPPAVLDRPRVEVDSLSGLVDTAIDVDARVFERPDGDAFYVPHENLLYVWTPPTVGPDGTPGGEATVDGESDGRAADDADAASAGVDDAAATDEHPRDS